MEDGEELERVSQLSVHWELPQDPAWAQWLTVQEERAAPDMLGCRSQAGYTDCENILPPAPPPLSATSILFCFFNHEVGSIFILFESGLSL